MSLVFVSSFFQLSWYFGKNGLLTFRKNRMVLNFSIFAFRGPFFQSSDNFSGPKSNIQIEIKRIRARVLASKIVHFVSLSDSFIMLDEKLLKIYLSCKQQQL